MSLQNANIVVTRPKHQGKKMIALLESAGANVLHCPSIEVQPTPTTPANLEKITRLKDYQMLVFISQNAVEHGLALLRIKGLSANLLPPIAAIGKTTAALLEAQGLTVSACPDTPNSLALMQTSAVQALPAKSRVLVFRGRGGKEVLAKAMAKRQISADYAEVYQRLMPENLQIPRTMDNGAPIDLIMFTSRDGLENFFAAAGAENMIWLKHTQLLLGSPSMLAAGKSLGLTKTPVLAASPLDQDMFEAAQRWGLHMKQF